jgi:S-adenosylmethionine hydrolase
VRTPVVTLLTDYGLTDDFVGVCHGVIAGICPPVRIIDITHGIPRHDVRTGAIVLAGALPFMPEGVHVAVVDPDVGASRRAIALAVADGRRLVGPDNGLLMAAAEACGGILEAVDIAQSPVRLEPVSATFHGRDIFSPVAAHLAAGTSIAEVGRPTDPDGLVRLWFPRPRFEVSGTIVAHVLYVDRFGNAALNIDHDDLSACGLQLGHRVTLGLADRAEPAQYLRTFAEAPQGELIVYEDAYRRLAVAVSHGDAAARLGLAAGDELRVGPA